MAVGMTVRGVPVMVRWVEDDEPGRPEERPEELGEPVAVVEPSAADRLDEPNALDPDARAEEPVAVVEPSAADGVDEPSTLDPDTKADEPNTLDPDARLEDADALDPDARVGDAELDPLPTTGSAVEATKPLLSEVTDPNPVEELLVVERAKLPAKVEGETWLIGVTTGLAVAVPWRGSVIALWSDWDGVRKLVDDGVCELAELEAGLTAVELSTPVASKVDEQTDSVSVSAGASVELGRLVGSTLVEPVEIRLAAVAVVEVEGRGIPVGTTVPVECELAAVAVVEVESTGTPVGTTVLVPWPFPLEELLSLVDAARTVELLPVSTGACRGAWPAPPNRGRLRRGPASAAATSARARSIKVICISPGVAVVYKVERVFGGSRKRKDVQRGCKGLPARERWEEKKSSCGIGADWLLEEELRSGLFEWQVRVSRSPGSRTITQPYKEQWVLNGWPQRQTTRK